MFSYHCIVIIPSSHLAGGSTKRVVISHSRVGKQLVMGPWLDQLAGQSSTIRT